MRNFLAGFSVEALRGGWRQDCCLNAADEGCEVAAFLEGKRAFRKSQSDCGRVTPRKLRRTDGFYSSSALGDAAARKIARGAQRTEPLPAELHLSS